MTTPAIQAAAQILKDSGVTCKDICLMSVALYIIDWFTSAVVRMQDKSNLIAWKTVVVKYDVETLLDVLPDHCKNDYSAMQGPGGMIATHAKHPMIEEPYAVLAVLGRALLRLHGRVLDEQIAPLDEHGQAMAGPARLNLFRRAGWDFLGIPRLGEGIFRTMGITMAVKRLHDEGVDIKTDEGINRFAREIRSSAKTALRAYNNTKPPHLKGYGILDQGNRGLGGPKKSKVEGGGESMAAIAASMVKMAEAGARREDALLKILLQQGQQGQQGQDRKIPAQAHAGLGGIPAGPPANRGQGGIPAAHRGQGGIPAGPQPPVYPVSMNDCLSICNDCTVEARSYRSI